MRMKHQIRKGEDARHPGDSLIAENKRPHQILRCVFLCLCLGQQGRQAIYPGVTDHTPIAFIQFGPVSGTSIRQRGGIAIQLVSSGVEHRCLGGAGAVRNAVMQRQHLRLTARRDNGTKIVAQNKRRAVLHRCRNVRPFCVDQKGNKFIQILANFDCTHQAGSSPLRVSITSSDGITSAYLPFMSQRFTACEVGARS